MTRDTLYALLYLEINLVSILLVILIRISSLGITRMNAQRHFSMAMDSQAVFFLADTIAVLTMRHILPAGNWILLLSKAVYFFSCTLLCFFWMLYFENVRGSEFAHNHRHVMRATALIWLVGILEAANLFTGFLFYADGNCVYHRGPLFLLQYVIAYAYVLIAWGRGLQDYMKSNDPVHRKRLLPLLFYPIAPAAAGILQFIWPELPLLCVALSVSALVIYLRWVSSMISLDPLTRLNNRRQLEHQFSLWTHDHHSDDIWLLLIDADKFKRINDTWGHTQGDLALIRIAEAMRRTVKKHSLKTCLARFGGDEFTILARTSDPEKVLALKEEVKKQLSLLNEEAQSPFAVSVSIGIAKAEDGRPLETLIKAADETLYEEKKTRG